ncbi:MAG: BrnT family toxin [Myxococcota bacterium]
MDPIGQLRRCTGFEWDDGNSGKSWHRHQVSDGECEQVFFNQPLLALPDDAHSIEEDRILVLGKTDSGRRLLVVCTVRGDLIRVISARDMTKPEREVYYANG